MKSKNSGITLIELVLSIIIIAICFTPVAIIYQEVLSKVYQTRVAAVAIALAEEEIDRVLRLEYSDINIAELADWQTIETGNFGGTFVAYIYNAAACYVNPSDDLDTPYAAQTDYIAIRVQVDHPDIGTITVRSLVTNL